MPNRCRLTARKTCCSARLSPSLIDRSLLAQDAKRHIKDKKMIDRLYEEADNFWRMHEVLPLQREYKVDSESKLKEALAEEGRSLDNMRQSFRQYFLAETYLHEKLKDRIKVELPDLLRYYNEHLQDHEFDRPAADHLARAGRRG